MLDTAQRGSGAVEGGAPSSGRRGTTVACRCQRVPTSVWACLIVLLLAVIAVGGAGAAGGAGATLAQENTTVTVVADTETAFGQETADLVERGVDLAENPLDVRVVDSTAVNDTVIAETDAFVFQYFESGVASEVIPTVENDSETHAVYLDQTGLEFANALFEREQVLDDPTLVTGEFESGEANPVAFEIQTDHPLFEGVGGPNETVLVHNQTDSDRVFFEDAEGETLATVGIAGEPADGAVAAVDPGSDSVLLGTVATHPAQSESAFTDAAARVLGNAVLFGVETEPPVLDLSGLDIAGQGSDALVTGTGNVTVNVSHVGGGAGEGNVSLSVGGVNRTQTLSLGVNESTTVTFENATATLAPGEYDLTVSAGEDSLTGTLLVSVAVGDNDPATDTDGDGLLDDIDGNGVFTIFDVQEFFTSFQNPVVQTNADLFNFDGSADDSITIFDVQSLFLRLAG